MSDTPHKRDADHPSQRADGALSPGIADEELNTEKESGALKKLSQELAFLAGYQRPEDCLRAAQRVRDAGYTRWDVHTPYPVHGMDQAMGLRETKLGWISFVAGITGCISAVLMIQWMNGIDYPLIVGGKPPNAIISMAPIMFELSVLLTGFGTFFGLLTLCRLPRHHHIVFASDRFQGASDDRFIISIESSDRQFDAVSTKQLLENTQPEFLELVEESVEK